MISTPRFDVLRLQLRGRHGGAWVAHLLAPPDAAHPILRIGHWPASLMDADDDEVPTDEPPHCGWVPLGGDLPEVLDARLCAMAETMASALYGEA